MDYYFTKYRSAQSSLPGDGGYFELDELCVPNVIRCSTAPRFTSPAMDATPELLMSGAVARLGVTMGGYTSETARSFGRLACLLWQHSDDWAEALAKRKPIPSPAFRALCRHVKAIGPYERIEATPTNFRGTAWIVELVRRQPILDPKSDTMTTRLVRERLCDVALAEPQPVESLARWFGAVIEAAAQFVEALEAVQMARTADGTVLCDPEDVELLDRHGPWAVEPDDFGHVVNDQGVRAVNLLMKPGPYETLTFFNGDRTDLRRVNLALTDKPCRETLILDRDVANRLHSLCVAWQVTPSELMEKFLRG